MYKIIMGEMIMKRNNIINRLFILFSALIFTFVFSISRIPNASAYGWGISKNNQHKVPDVGFYKNEIEGTDSYYVGSEEKKIYLTFDAGYDNGNIEKIVKILKEYEVPATFFSTGDFLERNPDLVKLIDENGLIIGNHMYSHKDITKISDEVLKEEITKVEEIFKSITGKEMIKLFRPPKGEFTKEALLKVKNLGYKTFFWSIAYLDWNTKDQKGEDYTYNSVINNLHDGAIILMHSVSDDNVKCLPKIIEKARTLGYTFDSLENIH